MPWSTRAPSLARPRILAASRCRAGAAADTIVLTNGRVIEADRAWFEGSQLRYEKDGGSTVLPRASSGGSTSGRRRPKQADPDVRRARELLAAIDAAEAARLARRAR